MNYLSFQFCKQRSFSDSDINSCEEFLAGARPFSGYVSQDSRLASIAASLVSSEDSHSISHYGSETAMELYNRAEQIQAGLGQDLINTIELVEEEEEADASLLLVELDLAGGRFGTSRGPRTTNS